MTTKPALAKARGLAARRVFALLAVGLRCSSVEAPSCLAIQPPVADSMLSVSCMKAFTSFLLGLILGGAAVWYIKSPRAHEKVKSETAAVQEKVTEAVPEVKAALRGVGEKVADATADARITTAIKVKLAADPELSVLQISVDTTAGLVTLAGKVKSPGLVDKAIDLAKSVDGVVEVKSTLQVNPDSK